MKYIYALTSGVLFLSATASAGIWGTLEWHDVISPYEKIITNSSGRFVNISGLCGNSSLSVGKYETRIVGDELQVLIPMILPIKGASGSFNISIPVPYNIHTITFGEKRRLLEKGI